MRARRLPASEPTLGPASSSSTSRPMPAQLAGHPVGARPLVAGRALDPAQGGERLVQALALGVGGAPHRAAAGSPSRRRPASAASAYSSAAPTNSRNSGAGRSGRDLNSGWYCEATKNGCSVGGQLDRLDQPLVRAGARADQPGRLEAPAQVVVDLVAVAVALVDDRLARTARGCGSRRAASPGRRPAASCRPCRRSPSARAAGRSPGTASRGRTRSSWRPPCRPRGGRTRPRRAACRGRCRGTGSASRGRSGRPGSCPRSRGRRSRRG